MILQAGSHKDFYWSAEFSGRSQMEIKSPCHIVKAILISSPRSEFKIAYDKLSRNVGIISSIGFYDETVRGGKKKRRKSKRSGDYLH